jgi:hypothetical protein
MQADKGLDFEHYIFTIFLKLATFNVNFITSTSTVNILLYFGNQYIIKLHADGNITCNSHGVNIFFKTDHRPHYG